MAPSVPSTEEQPQYTEMKPMVIHKEAVPEHQDFSNDPSKQAQMAPSVPSHAEQPQYTEMKPMVIHREAVPEHQDFSNDPSKQAQMAPSVPSHAEQPQFTEMKPMVIHREAVPENQATSSDAAKEAQIAECMNAINRLQQQIVQVQTGGHLAASLPEESVTERAFTAAVTEYKQYPYEEELVEDVPEVPPRRVKMEPGQKQPANPEELVNNAFANLIHIEASFSSFAEFDAAFRSWKEAGHHPMRIASSEALKDPSGKVDEKFRYKHAVYHCAHYGKPRFRGNGARPNQSYLPCGCPAMFRLNFNYFEQVLRVTSMNVDHVGHPVTYDHYKAVCSNIRSTKRSRLSDNSSWTASPLPGSSVASSSSSYNSTPFSVKQEVSENYAQDSSGRLVGTPPARSAVIRSDDYCRKRGSSDDDEEWTPTIKKERNENRQSTSRSGRQIRIPARNQEEGYDEVAREEYADNVIDVPAMNGLPKMKVGAAYKNWRDFEAAFENWKSVGMHPMRVASSETMKDLNGVPNVIYKYKYVVFHCAHYGTPRMRGNGMRPNQSYLPCGCGCMLRLAYNFEDQTLRVNAIVEEHRGHPRDRKFFEKVMAKIRSSRGRHGTARMTNSAVSSPVASYGGSLTQPGTPAGGLDINQLVSMLTAQTQMNMQLLQQTQPGTVDVSAILQLGAMPGINVAQQNNASETPVELAGLARPIAQHVHEGGAIIKDLNADLKDL